jgi:hypothetical protein
MDSILITSEEREDKMSRITVTWKSFAREGVREASEASRAIEVESANGVADEMLCEFIFRDTNTYSGSLWDLLQPLPEDRTHTALSVGDAIEIDGRVWECADLGFKRIA